MCVPPRDLGERRAVDRLAKICCLDVLTAALRRSLVGATPSCTMFCSRREDGYESAWQNQQLEQHIDHTTVLIRGDKQLG